MSIYCFDLDGTLAKAAPDGRSYDATRPIPERIAIVNQLFDDGHHIIVDSARGTVSGENWQQRTAEQLKAWGLKYHELRTGVKVFADFYIDDRALSDREFFRADD